MVDSFPGCGRNAVTNEAHLGVRRLAAPGQRRVLRFIHNWPPTMDTRSAVLFRRPQVRSHQQVVVDGLIRERAAVRDAGEVV